MVHTFLRKIPVVHSMGNIIFKKVQYEQVSCDFNAPNGFVVSPNCER